MTYPLSGNATVAPGKRRRQIFSWALWDWGTSAFSVLIVTFVFSRYIVSSYFVDPAIVSAYQAAGGANGSGPAKIAYDAAVANLTSWVGWAMAIGGIVVALIAPVLGQRTDAGGRRKLWLGINTGIVILATFALFFVQGAPQYFVLGIVLMTVGNVFYEMANVNYNAMLLQIATPKTMGRISGFGWGMGYLGGIVVLLVSLFGFVLGDPPYLFGIGNDAGLNIRVIAVFAAIWSLVFSIPVLVSIPENAATSPVKVNIIASYAEVGRSIARLFTNARSTFYFLLASAIYRDGLTAVFSFGGILAGAVFGLSDTQIILFAIAGNLIAGIGVFLGGVIDDRIGSKRVILGSLIGLIVAGSALFFLHNGGVMIFWIFGLTLSFFVGPAQASSRALLAHMAPEGEEGAMFGLYATTGRAVTWLSPALFALFVMIGGSTFWGILAIVLVLIAGLLLLIPIRAKFMR